MSIYIIYIIIKDLTEYIMDLKSLIGKPHFDYKEYTEKFNIVVEAIDEIAFLSNTLDYERLAVFFKEVVETFDYYKNIDENDENSEGFSIMDNKEQLILNIINCAEYDNLVNFMETYRTTIIRKCDNLKDKIIELNEFKSKADSESDSGDSGDKKNTYIAKDYASNVELIHSKLKGIDVKLLDNIEKTVYIAENKLKFNIKLITKNDIICVLSLYRSLKNLVYKQMHVIDKEYYTATKEDVLAFRKELYKLYEMICEYFNNNRKTFVDVIRTKFQELYNYVDGDGKAVVKVANADVEKAVAKADANADVEKAEKTANAANAANADANAADDANASNEERDLKKLEEEMKNKEGELDNREQLVQENKELLAKALVAPAPPRVAVGAPPRVAVGAQPREELSRRPTPPEALSRVALEAPEAPEAPEALSRGEQYAAAKAEAEAKAKAQLKGATDAVAGAQAKVEAELKEATDTATQLKKQTEAQFKGVADNFLSLTSLTKGANGEPASPSGIFSQLAQKALKLPK